MEWMDSVRSREYQRPKTTASRTEKVTELIHSGTPRASVRLSVSSVPTTLISTTESQYTHGTYSRLRNWTTRLTTRAAVNSSVVFVRPKPRVSLT